MRRTLRRADPHRPARYSSRLHAGGSAGCVENDVLRCRLDVYGARSPATPLCVGSGSACWHRLVPMRRLAGGIVKPSGRRRPSRQRASVAKPSPRRARTCSPKAGNGSFPWWSATTTAGSRCRSRKRCSPPSMIWSLGCGRSHRRRGSCAERERHSRGGRPIAPRTPALLPADLCASLRAWQTAGWSDDREPEEWRRVVEVFNRIHRRDDTAIARGARWRRRHGTSRYVADVFRLGDVYNDD
jgi:hypothetical protein